MATVTASKRNAHLLADSAEISGNLVINGNITASSYNNSNWDTAYGWGNHASQGYATQAYVNNAVSNLVDSAPTTLDTLNELAAALGDDPNFAATVSDSIGSKVSKSGDTMTGDLSIGSNKIKNSDGYYYTPYISGGIGTRSELISAANFLIHADTDGSGTAEFVSIRAGAGTANELKLLSKTSSAGVNNQSLTLNGNKVFNDAYHPNADKWTTARTITLGGDLSGSVSLDGSSNVTLSAQVSNNSHSHNYIYSDTQSSVPSNALQYLNTQGNSDDSPSTDWYTTLRMGHGNPNTYYNNTIAVKMTGGDVGSMYLRHRNNGTAGSWRRVFEDNYHPNADKWTTARTLSLTGDVTGSVSWDGSANASITATVVNDSHNHDHSDGGFQVNGKLKVTAGADIVSTSSNPFRWQRSSLSQTGQDDNVTVYVDDSNIYFTHNNDSDGDASGFRFRRMTGGSPQTIFDFDHGGIRFLGSNVYRDNYHPEADKWTTARSHTVTLTGEVTGTATQTVDGTGNRTWTVNTTLNNSALNDQYVNKTGDTMSGQLTVNSNVVVTGDLKLNGSDSYIWTPNTAAGYTGFWDQYNARLALQYTNNHSGWGVMGNSESGTALKVHGNSKITGGLEIAGNLARGSYTSASQYHTNADNIVLKGNASGISGIFFESEKDGTNINHSSDFGFIQFHPYGTGTSGESNELIIGVSNDGDDHVVVNAPNVNGFKFRIGASATDYTVWHAGNFNPNDYLLTSNYVDNYADSVAFNTSTGVLTIGRTGSLADLTVDLDGRYLTSETDNQTLSWNGTNGVLSISGGNSVDLDGRYLQSYSETDTLQSVCSRGNTTNTDVIVNGLLTATQKSFTIDHPTKEGHKLRYGSLEGPENGVYVRGRLKDSNVIELPDVWVGLVHEDSITVSLTAIGKSQEIWVEDIMENKVIVGGDNVNCFYHVFAERKDVDKLVTEFQEVE